MNLDWSARVGWSGQCKLTCEQRTWMGSPHTQNNRHLLAGSSQGEHRSTRTSESRAGWRASDDRPQRREAPCLLLGRAVCVGRHVHHERSGSTVVEEVDGDSHAPTPVRGCEGTGEVWEEVDSGAIVLALGKNTCDGDADVWLSVCNASVKGNEEGGGLGTYSYQ